MLLTTREVARRLCVSEQRIRKLIYEGRIKAIKVGGPNLIAEKDAPYTKKRNYPQKDDRKL